MADPSQRPTQRAMPTKRAAGQQSMEAKSQQASEEEDEDLEDEDDDSLKAWMRLMPAGLTSMVVHIVVLLILALWLLPEEKPPKKEDVIAQEQEAPPEEEEEEEEEDIEIIEEETEEVEEEQLVTEEVPLEVETIISEFNEELAKEDSLVLDNIEPLTPFGELSSFNEMTDATHDGGSDDSGLGRMSRGRRSKKMGGSRASEKAVEKALKWIASHQNRDGGFSFKLSDGVPGCTCPNHGSKTARNGATGMAMLPFLGANYTHQSKGKYKKYNKVVGGGLKYMLQKMKTDGSLWEGDGRMYSHGLAACAVAEGYGMTKDPDLKRPAQAALDYIVRAQDAGGGGWRYKPGDPGDTSVVGWQLMALKSGVLSELNVPKAPFTNAERFLDSVGSQSGSYYGYTSPGTGKATTAIGHLSKIVMGGGQEDPSVQRGADIIGNWGPSWENMYYTYYAAQVMHHTRALDDEARWNKWNTAMRDPLIEQQAEGGHEEGSWMMTGKDHGYKSGGRLYCTSLGAMMLEVYYRYMPIYGDKAGQEVEEGGVKEVLDD